MSQTVRWVCQIRRLIVVGAPGDGVRSRRLHKYAESKTNGCRAQRTTRADGGREWSATGSFHRNLESRPRLASRKAAIIASRDSLRPCRQRLGHTQRKIRAITIDRRSHRFCPKPWVGGRLPQLAGWSRDPQANQRPSILNYASPLSIDLPRKRCISSPEFSPILLLDPGNALTFSICLH